MAMIIRRMLPEEVETAAQLCFDSFKAFNDSVGLPCEFAGVVPVALMRHNQAHPQMACFVAVVEATKSIVGTNCIDLRGEVGVSTLLSAMSPHPITCPPTHPPTHRYYYRLLAPLQWILPGGVKELEENLCKHASRRLLPRASQTRC